MSDRPIRVLIADDHPLYRDGLRTMLERAPETEIVGEAREFYAVCRRMRREGAKPMRIEVGDE